MTYYDNKYSYTGTASISIFIGLSITTIYIRELQRRLPIGSIIFSVFLNAVSKTRLTNEEQLLPTLEEIREVKKQKFYRRKLKGINQWKQKR